MSKKGIKNAHYIVCHGLNVTPDAMKLFMTDLGIPATSCSFIKLSGHAPVPEDDLKEVTAQTWIAEFDKQFTDLLEKHRTQPVIFVGYSLGGLLFINHITHTKISLHKIILLAPALSFKFWSRIPDWFHFAAIKKLVLPSLTPKKVRANSGVTLAAYKALFDIFRKANHDNLLTTPFPPAIILCDSNDELISVKGLKKYIDQKTPKNWNFHLLHSSFFRNMGKKHLLISRQHQPDSYWKNLKEYILNFIKE